MQIENQYCPISFFSYSDVSIFWLADISSIVLFPIYLRYHPDGLGGSVKPAHKKLLLPTPQDSKIQSHPQSQSQAPPDIVMHIHWGAFKSLYIFVDNRDAIVWYPQLPSNKPWTNPPFNMTSSCILGFQVTRPATFYSFSVYCTLANRKVFLRQITAGCKHNSAQLDKWLEILAVEGLTAYRKP